MANSQKIECCSVIHSPILKAERRTCEKAHLEVGIVVHSFSLLFVTLLSPKALLEQPVFHHFTSIFI